MFRPGDYSFAETSPEVLHSRWWIGHIPFAFEMTRRLAPKCIVELGTYSGSSFFAFCQAVVELGLPSRCYAIDLWEGDIHMGSFDESLYQDVAAYASSRYPDTAILVRKDFHEAASDFERRSVDLLHIDGTHTFEAVSDDYYTWLPKMSEQGVILFHDTNVSRENLGPAAEKYKVRRLFDSLRGCFPHIEFEHSYGLGALFVGDKIPAHVARMIEDAGDPAFTNHFARLGGELSRRFESEQRVRENAADTRPSGSSRPPGE